MRSITAEAAINSIKAKAVSWKKYLFLATAGHFTNDFYNGFLSPLLPIIVVNMDLSMTSAGGLLTILSISNSLTQPIAGYFADRFKRYYFVLFGPVVTGVFMGLLGWVNHYWLLLLVLTFGGIGTAAFHPPAAALVGNLTSRRKGFAMSIFNTSGAFGVAVGSIAIIPLVTRFGMKATIFTALLSVLLFAYSFPYFQHLKKAPVRDGSLKNLFGIIKTNRVLVFNLHMVVVLRAVLLLAFSGFVPLLLTSMGHSTFFGAIGLAVFQFFSVAGILLGGHIFDRFGAKKLLIASFILALPFALLFLNIASIYGLPFLAAMGFLLSSSTPVNIILGQRISPKHASFMSSIMMGLGWGVAGLFMIVIGAIADQVGIFWALTGVSFLALPGLALSFIVPLKK